MQYLTITIAIIGCVISVITFFKNGEKSSNKDTQEESYKWGKFDEKLSNIEKALTKIEQKLDNYDVEIDKKIEEAMKHHIKEYHK